MTYNLHESGNIIGGESFESFWLFVRFGINEQTKQLQVQRSGNYFAFYGSATSNARDLDLPEFGDEPGQVQSKSYELKGKNDLALGLNSLALQESRCTDMSNESAHLHIFQFLATPDQANCSRLKVSAPKPRACWRMSARSHSSRISPNSGCTSATWSR